MIDVAEFYSRERSHEVLTAQVEAAPPFGHTYHAPLAYLKRHQKRSVLELGYGNVQFAGLYGRWTERTVLADVVDRSAGAVLPCNVEILVADFNGRWPIEDRAFDTVVALNVFEHLFDPFLAFSETSRVLKSGGTAFVGLPMAASLRRRLSLLAGRMPVTSEKSWFENRQWDGGHLHLFTIRDTVRCASLYGLECIALMPCGRWPRLKALWPGLLAAEMSFCFRKL